MGTKGELGESIIQDVKGVSVVIQRSLRDLLHQIPSIEVLIKVMDYMFIDCFVKLTSFLILILGKLQT